MARIARTLLILLVALAACQSPSTRDVKPDATPQDPLAVAFGTMPQVWGVRLSPDGTKVSYLQMMQGHEIPIAVVLDFASRQRRLVLASEKDRFDIKWCEWANNERLLCGFRAITRDGHMLYSVSRLVAVNADSSGMKVLMQRKLSETFAQFQDGIVDWLPSDPDHVLIAKPGEGGTGVSRLDIYTGSESRKLSPRRSIRSWMSDGRGTVRLRRKLDERLTRWDYRLAGESSWHRLHESKHADYATAERYYPVGFGEDPNQLLVLKPHEGRLALWSEDLSQDQKSTLVFSHPEVDVGGVLGIGKFGRMVAVEYSTDRNHLHFFDAEVERLSARLRPLFPDQGVQIVDESWDRNFYIVHVGSQQNPGAYYRFDVGKRQLGPVSPQFPALDGVALASMTPIRYTARDDVEIPGYLTVPASATQGSPAVVLPHGGPESRDYWGYDWLSQYLAARGFVVLQSNYRGSGGYGTEWTGDGGFRNWRRAIDDISDGARYLAGSGLADPDRICIVGWSYGGYAALLSAAEYPDLYRCVVSIAGVTDLPMLIAYSRSFVGARRTREFIGDDSEVLEAGSPARRADEITVPVLLFHGDEDINVDIRHSEEMESALRRNGKQVEFIEYENVEHSLLRSAPRIDMLDRAGSFLLDHTMPRELPQ
jgi:dienelactone hydrolase